DHRAAHARGASNLRTAFTTPFARAGRGVSRAIFAPPAYRPPGAPDRAWEGSTRPSARRSGSTRRESSYRGARSLQTRRLARAAPERTHLAQAAERERAPAPAADRRHDVVCQRPSLADRVLRGRGRGGAVRRRHRGAVAERPDAFHAVHLQIVRYLDAPAGLGESEVVDKRMWERGDGGDERASRDARAVRENGLLAACCHEL